MKTSTEEISVNEINENKVGFLQGVFYFVEAQSIIVFLLNII